MKVKRERPVKIKRYRRSFSGAGDRNNLLRTVVRWLIVAAVLFGVGWLIAKPGLDLASRLWYAHRNAAASSAAQPLSQPPAAESGSDAPSSPSDSAAAPAQDAAAAGTGWASVALSQADTPEKAAALAAQLKEQGVQYAVLTLKDERGYVYYASAVPQARNSIASTTIDAAAVAKAFTDAGVTPVAAISAFRDAIAPYTDRSMAVKYGTEGDIIWLDSSAELGGKPWLNPNSAAAQQYVADLLTELRNLGFSTVLVRNLQFPQGYSLNVTNYGAMTGTQDQLLTSLGKRYEATEGLQVWFEFPSQAIAGTDLTGYGASPAGFGLSRVVVAAAGTAAAADAPAAAPDEGTLSSLLAALQQGGTQSVSLHLTGVTDAAALTAAAETAQRLGYAGFFTVP